MPKFDLFSMLVFGLVACACNAKQAGESETTGNIEQTLTDPDGPPPPREPPKEAFAACAESSEGDTCSVVLGDRTIDGDCRRGPNGEGQLACAPHHPEPPVPDARLDE